MANSNPYAITDPAEMVVDTRNFIPSHPGPMIRENISDHGLTLTQAATAIKTPLPFLSNMLNGKKPVSIEMAMRIEAAFGLDARMIHGMSDLFESHKAMQRRDEIVAGIARVARRQADTLMAMAGMPSAAIKAKRTRKTA